MLAALSYEHFMSAGDVCVDAMDTCYHCKLHCYQHAVAPFASLTASLVTQPSICASSGALLQAASRIPLECKSSPSVLLINTLQHGYSSRLAARFPLFIFRPHFQPGGIVHQRFN